MAASALPGSIRPFLHVPPFPGARIDRFEPLAGTFAMPDRQTLVATLRRHRVGGHYWAPARPRPVEASVLVREPDLEATARDRLTELGPIVVTATPRSDEDGDLWTMLDGAAALVCDEQDPARLVAAVLTVPTFLRRGSGLVEDRAGLDELERNLASMSGIASPFDGRPMELLETIALCGFWRRLVESNRGLVGALGFAFWKQDALKPLLWAGDKPLPFWRNPPPALTNGAVAVWQSKARADHLAALQRRGTPLVEVEDGFLRSAGLGADCVPPLSVTVDRLGPYFDPAGPSELEQLLEEGQFDEPMLARAQQLRETIVAQGLGKYEHGRSELQRLGGTRRHILVPGQVEDDRSVMTGGGGMPNAELLRRVRAANPDAYLIYKPHPDVEAGHRRGIVQHATSSALADQVMADAPIAALLDMVDEVHVNTSLAGFEALLRGKAVTTYGVPFYAGWGLTTDLGAIPPRRTRRRSLDELVAAALLVYPRYLDPLTGLPCPAEVAVDRLIGNSGPDGVLVRLRRLQGKVRRRWQEIVAP